MTAPTVVVGVGNRDRMDDAAGPLLADEIGRRRPDLTIVERVGDLSTLGLEWQPEDRVVVIDAVHCDRGGPRLVADIDLGDVERRRPVSSHGVALGDALRLAHAVGRAPAGLRIVGVTGHRFGLGPPPGDLVDAVPRLADEVLSLLDGEGDGDRATTRVGGPSTAGLPRRDSRV